MRSPRARTLAFIWLPLIVAAGVGGWFLVPSVSAAGLPAVSSPPPIPKSSTSSSTTTPAPAGAGGVPAKVIYEQDCAACHGDDGKGTRRGPDLTGVGEAAVDFELSTGRMPKRGAASRQPPYRATIPEADVKALDQYVTNLVAKGGPAIPAMDPAKGDQAHGHLLFDEDCAACHGWGGSGGILYTRMVPAITEATPSQVGEAVRVGPSAMPIFGPHQLSQSQLNDIDAYIEQTKHPSDQGGDAISHLGPAAEGAVVWLVAMAGLLLLVRWIGERG